MIWIIALCITHWIGDFVLQSDAMAKAKSSNNIVLIDHVAIYTAILALFASMWFILNSSWHGLLMAVLFVKINGILHLVTDYYTSRLNTRLWNEKRVHDFFVSVGFDQLLHQIALFVTLWWLLL